MMSLLLRAIGNRFIAALKANVEQIIAGQTGQVLKEFSLDNPEGTLLRLVRELTEKHGSLPIDESQ